MDGHATVIETHGLVKRFAEANAVDGIDLNVPAGGVYGFLGPNGAGKTTTIRILVGLLWPTRGSSRIFGEPIAPGAPVLQRVGSLIERLAADGTTVFLSSHVLPEVEQLCDRVAILREGRIVAEGPTGDLLGAGERLFVRFDTPAEAAAAQAILGPIATPTDGGPAHAGSALLVNAPL